MVKKKSSKEEGYSEANFSVDMSSAREYAAHPIYYPLAKEIKRRRRSYPGEPVYQKRYKWWIDHSFGDSAAKWAASYRLGLPKKTVGLKEGEEVAIEKAIKTGERRPLLVETLSKKFNKSKEKVIAELDKKLRLRDKAKKIEKGLIAPGIALLSPRVESNIFTDTSD